MTNRLTGLISCQTTFIGLVSRWKMKGRNITPAPVLRNDTGATTDGEIYRQERHRKDMDLRTGALHILAFQAGRALTKAHFQFAAWYCDKTSPFS